MAAKKMLPPGDATRVRGHIESPIGGDYDEVKLRISFRILAGQIVMQFSDHVEWIRMSSSGARKLAAMLTEKAAELDRLGDVPLKKNQSTVMPPKRPSRVAKKTGWTSRADP